MSEPRLTPYPCFVCGNPCTDQPHVCNECEKYNHASCWLRIQDSRAEIDRLRGELSDRDRQLAELREICEPLAEAWRSFAKHAPMGSKDACGLSVPADPLRALAALLPPTAKEADRAAKE